jgi:hypothetical protein
LVVAGIAPPALFGHGGFRYTPGVAPISGWRSCRRREVHYTRVIQRTNKAHNSPHQASPVELVAEFGYGEVPQFQELRIADLQRAPVTGIGESQHIRVLDTHGRVALKLNEDVVLRHRDDWWLVRAADMRDAYERALARDGAIIIDDPAHVQASRLPADAAERRTELARLRALGAL